MAKNAKKFKFKSVGETVEEVLEKGEAISTSPTPIGIATPIMFSSKKDTVFLMHEKAVDQIKDNLRNLISTNHGERLLFFDYGANLKELTTEVGNEAVDEQIMERIQTAVGKFMPFVALGGYTPIRKMSKSGTVLRLGMIMNFSVPQLEIENEDMEIILFEAI